MEKDDKKKNPLWVKILIVLAVIICIMAIAGKCSDSGSDDDSSSSQSKSSKVVKHKSSKKSSKSLVSKKQIWKNLQDQLANCEENSDGLITKAEIKNNALYLTISDDALSGSDAEVKEAAKKAWDWGNKQYNYFTPLPEGKWDTNLIYVETAAGNRLAETSFTEEFKYLGD